MKIKKLVTVLLVTFILASCVPATEEVVDEYEKHYEQGCKFYESGDFEQAISSLSIAINANPENISAYLLRIRVYRSVYEYEKAFQDIDKVLELDPNSYDAHFLRGLIFFDAKEYDEAITEYTTALELSKENKLPLYFRAFAYSSNGEHQLAIDDFQQYLVFVPDTPNRARIEAMIESLEKEVEK